jgi:hypothetical protein
MTQILEQLVITGTRMVHSVRVAASYVQQTTGVFLCVLRYVHGILLSDLSNM